MNLEPCPLIHVTRSDPLGLHARAWRRALPYLDAAIESQPPDMAIGLRWLRESNGDRPFLRVEMRQAPGEDWPHFHYGLDITGEPVAWLLDLDCRLVGIELDGKIISYRPDPICDADLIAVLDDLDDRLRDDGAD